MYAYLLVYIYIFSSCLQTPLPPSTPQVRRLSTIFVTQHDTLVKFLNTHHPPNTANFPSTILLCLCYFILFPQQSCGNEIITFMLQVKKLS